MIHNIRLRLRPEELSDQSQLRKILENKTGEKVNDCKIIRKSIDSRQRQVWIDIEATAATGSDLKVPVDFPFVNFKPVPKDAPDVIIIGAGPAGLFAALRAIELGWRPIVIERGKKVEDRLKDVVTLQKEGIVDPDSNFCYGEGGAGAFSDGKLFTRSKKRGNVKEILALLHQHGAREEIMYEAHPHIGSDRLPKIIREIRNTILDNGGEILFSTTFKSLIFKNHKVVGVITDSDRKFYGPVILATGHSSREVYEYLHSQNIRLEQKGIAMGVRLEHPQNIIDSIVYHSKNGRGPHLPPAEYKLATQVDGRGVYSFCMCPGGVIVPSASAPCESVVNGMSASGRSGKWANSGLVVEIHPEDFPKYSKDNTLGLLRLQKDLERVFYEESSSINAPAQRMIDFVEGKISKDLPRTSYVPGIHSADLSKLLPPQISDRLKTGFRHFGKKYPGFLTNDAVMIGLESRTSSPVRIPRDPVTLQHPDLPGLFPVGEGAGFAGGIVSSAIDGRRAMEALAETGNLG